MFGAHSARCLQNFRHGNFTFLFFTVVSVSHKEWPRCRSSEHSCLKKKTERAYDRPFRLLLCVQRIGCQPEKPTLHGGQSRSWSACMFVQQHHMFVCMIITFSRLGINRVWLLFSNNLARDQLNRGNEFFPFPVFSHLSRISHSYRICTVLYKKKRGGDEFSRPRSHLSCISHYSYVSYSVGNLETF